MSTSPDPSEDSPWRTRRLRRFHATALAVGMAKVMAAFRTYGGRNGGHLSYRELAERFCTPLSTCYRMVGTVDAADARLAAIRFGLLKIDLGLDDIPEQRAATDSLELSTTAADGLMCPSAVLNFQPQCFGQRLDTRDQKQ